MIVYFIKPFGLFFDMSIFGTVSLLGSLASFAVASLLQYLKINFIKQKYQI